jgi:hypothetical protein
MLYEPVSMRLTEHRNNVLPKSALKTDLFLSKFCCKKTARKRAVFVRLFY